MNVVGRLQKKLENLLFSENVEIEQSSFKFPDLSVRTVSRFTVHVIFSSA